MLLTIITIVVVSGALIIGAIWGTYGNLPDKTEGFLVGIAGGALLVSVILELIKPSVESATHLVHGFYQLRGDPIHRLRLFGKRKMGFGQRQRTARSGDARWHTGKSCHGRSTDRRRPAFRSGALWVYIFIQSP